MAATSNSTTPVIPRLDRGTQATTDDMNARLDRAIKSGDDGLGDQDLLERDIDAYLAKHQAKSLLRFITCGSVDDGKSTLIGRLLYDSKIPVRRSSSTALARRTARRWAPRARELDFALLVDGLQAEREQGITIDVAYRFFSTDPAQVHRRRHAGA